MSLLEDRTDYNKDIEDLPIYLGQSLFDACDTTNMLRNFIRVTQRFLASIWHHVGLILGLRPANERRRYFVTTSLIGWAHT